MSGDTNGVTSECNKRGTRQAAQAGLEADGRKPVTREATEAAREVDGADGGGRLVFQNPMREGWERARCRFSSRRVLWEQ